MVSPAKELKGSRRSRIGMIVVVGCEWNCIDWRQIWIDLDSRLRITDELWVNEGRVLRREEYHLLLGLRSKVG